MPCMRCQPRTRRKAGVARCTLYCRSAGSIRCTGAMSHSPRLAAATPPRLPTASVRAEKPRSASAPTTTSSATSWLPMIDQIGRVRGAADQRHLHIAAGIERGGQRVDLEKAVGLRETGDRAGPLAGRERNRAALAFDQRHQHEFLAAEFGGDAHRHARGDGLRGFRRQPGAGADHRRDESMEGEDRRGRKARQHHDRRCRR